MAELTEWIRQARGGDREASERLFRAVYGDLRRIAGRQVARGEAGGLGGTSLVHELYLRLAKPEALQVNDRRHFFSVAARAMRQIAVDRAREQLAAKRGSGAVATTLGAADGTAVDDGKLQELIDLDRALQLLDAADERLARLAELRLFSGLEVEQCAELLGLSNATIKRDWRKARAFLHAQLGDAAPGDEQPAC
jgi:RNA polymerase sigma factor (TIGR02999 family)